MPIGSVIRVALLAAAGLASLATSAPWIDVVRTTPLHLESAVPADVVPALELEAHGADLPPVASLRLVRLPEGTLVAGEARRRDAAGDALRYELVPAAPLQPGDYELVLPEGPGGNLSTTWDAYHETSELRWTDAGSEIVLRFSTRSAPAVRFVRPEPLGEGVVISFSQAMDPASLAAIEVLDATGDPLPATFTWAGGELHLARLVPPRGAVSLRFGTGVRGADGAPLVDDPAAIVELP